MKNNLTISAALFLLLGVGVGCSFLDNVTSSGNSSNGSTTSNSATNSADPNAVAKTGVAECDELIDMLNRDKNDPNDNFLTRKIKEYAIDFAKESIKKNIEENQGDKTKIAQGCKEAKDDYIRNKEKNDQNQNSREKNDNSQKL